MQTNYLDISIHRNADYLQEWQFCDNDGTPIDISDISFSLKIRANSGQGSVIASAIATKTDSENGKIQFKIFGSSFSSIQGQGEVVKLAYDVVMTYSDGIKFVPVEGHVILVPGVTY